MHAKDKFSGNLSFDRSSLGVSGVPRFRMKGISSTPVPSITFTITSSRICTNTISNNFMCYHSYNYFYYYDSWFLLVLSNANPNRDSEKKGIGGLD